MMLSPNQYITRRILTALIFLILLSEKSLATTIVVIKRPDKVVIAADSRSSNANGKILHDNACKIIADGNYVMAFSGVVIDEKRNLSAYKIALTAMQTKGLRTEKLNSFEILLKNMVTEYLALVKKENQSDYEKIKTSFYLEFVFAGLENGDTFAVFRKYRLAEDSLYLDIKYDCPNDCAGGGMILPFGNRANIESFLDKNPMYWKSNEEDAARKLIEMEIKPDGKTGGAIDVVRIDKTGIAWPSRKKDCQR
jgi:hypothetical protein